MIRTLFRAMVTQHLFRAIPQHLFMRELLFKKDAYIILSTFFILKEKKFQVQKLHFLWQEKIDLKIKQECEHIFTKYFVVHVIMRVQDKWDMDKLMIQCAQEEESLKKEEGQHSNKQFLEFLNKAQVTFVGNHSRVEAPIEAIGYFTLTLGDDFVLLLRDVLFLVSIDNNNVGLAI
ncbi:hypothetical protein ACJX0J_011566 [Zea mays]